VLRAGDRVKVRLIKHDKPDVEYSAVVLGDDGNHVVVQGPWAEPEARDIGPVRFEPGDVFTEHYWRDRWYSIKAVSDAHGTPKGWYCDVARPALVEPRSGQIVSHDLVLDLWASADGATVARLDDDEFAAGDLVASDPEAARHALHALDELERHAIDGFSILDAAIG
jgi:hypothetical protein